MKALIKGGLFLSLSWLASSADAQVQWRASTAKSPTPAAGTDTGVRAVSVGQPARLDESSAPTTASFRPLTEMPAAVVRGQAADDKTVPAFPKLETNTVDVKQAKPLPKDPNFTPPPPSALAPSPIFGSLGMGDDGCCDTACGTACRTRFCGFGGNNCCPERPRFWGSAEYLMWWQRGMSVPPLVTSSPAGQLDNIGVLGDPRTTILYDSVPNNTFGGGRFTAGMWLQHFCNVGIEARYFFLGRQTTSATFASDGSPQLARPFFDVLGGVQDAEFASPGSITINTYSQLWGIEGNIRHNLRRNGCNWCDFFWGYRHLNLSEGIDITEDAQQVIPGFGPLRTIEQESFRTRNLFNGFQFGLDGERRLGGRCFVGWSTRLAMGSVHQIINIDGTTTFVGAPPIGTVSGQGTLLTSPTNIGRYTANRFAVLPEIGLKIGVDLTDRWRIWAGYDFLYLSSVLRPGDQIDLNVNKNFTPFLDPGPPAQVRPGVGGGPRLPMVPYRTSDYWAQGFSFGLQYRY